MDKSMVKGVVVGGTGDPGNPDGTAVGNDGR